MTTNQLPPLHLMKLIFVSLTLSFYLVIACLPPPPTHAQDLTSQTFSPIADSTVKQEFPTTNYGSVNTLITSNYYSTNTQTVYLKFDLGSLTLDQIESATLRLTAALSRVVYKQVNFVSDNSWQESTLTWNNRPVSSTLLGSYDHSGSKITVGQVIDIPLNLANLPQNATQFSIAIENITTPTNTFKVYSKEASSGQPQLILQVISPSSPAPEPSPTPTPTPELTPTPTATLIPTPTACQKADINRDSIVDLSDYFELTKNFFKSGSNLSGDINQDSFVDLSDYSLLQRYFMQICSGS